MIRPQTTARRKGAVLFRASSGLEVREHRIDAVEVHGIIFDSEIEALEILTLIEAVPCPR